MRDPWQIDAVIYRKPERDQPVWIIWPSGHYFQSTLGEVRDWGEKFAGLAMTITTRPRMAGGSCNKVGLYA